MMLARRSLRVRLLLAAALSIAVALLLAGLGITVLFGQHVERRLERELLNHLNQLTAVFEVGEDGTPHITGPLSDPRFARPYSGLYWEIDDAGGTAIRSRSLWDFSLDLPPDQLPAGQVHVHRLAGPAGTELLAIERPLQLGQDLAQREFRLVVAVDRGEIHRNVVDFGQDMAFSLGMLALFLLIAAALQVAIGLRPLEDLRAELAKVRTGRASGLEASFPSEVQPLVDDLNSLLGQQAAAIERARTQAGNLAHGLKTPLSVLAAEGRKLRERGEATSADLIAQEIDTMGRHVDFQLARARAAGSRHLPGVVTPIAPCVARLLRAVRRLIDGELEITARIHPAHRFAGETQDLEEMVGNLVENACKWARQRVSIESHLVGERVEVVVDDDGPGLPAEQRGAAFERGRRLDRSVPGSGLGLAIVRDLAELYGGEVALEKAPLGGLRVRLVLPRPRQTSASDAR